MSKRNIIIIIIVVIVLVIAAVIILIQKDKPVLGPSPSDQKKVSEEISSETEEKEKEQVDPMAILKSQLGLQARSFIARYGTYSSDNRYGNLKMLLPQMSVRFAQETTNEIAQKGEEEQGFSSLTTRIMNLNLKSFNEKAEIVFIGQVQEQEVKNEKIGLQQKIIEISFVKENDQWKVDEIKTR
ncbi:hypothetical protein KKG58_02480 [Patescibacteria group bacterium]|nr:hypothetical protein [Patescibacteria group bacterium]